MKTFIRAFLVAITITNSLWAGSGLNFGAGGDPNSRSTAVNVGSAVALDNNAVWSVGMWVNPTGDAPAQTRALFGKFGISVDNGRRQCVSVVATTSEITCHVRENNSLNAYTTNNAGLHLNRPQYVGVSFNMAANAGETFNIYVGTTGSQLRECTYGTATDQTGTLDSDADGNFAVGNNEALARPFGDATFIGDIYTFKYWTRVVTAKEFQEEMEDPFRASTGTLFFHYYGSGSSDTAHITDWTGNGFTGVPSTGVVASLNAPPISFKGAFLE